MQRISRNLTLYLVFRRFQLNKQRMNEPHLPPVKPAGFGGILKGFGRFKMQAVMPGILINPIHALPFITKNHALATRRTR